MRMHQAIRRRSVGCTCLFKFSTGSRDFQAQNLADEGAVIGGDRGDRDR